MIGTKFSMGKQYVKAESENMLIPPRQIKLVLMKQFVKIVSYNSLIFSTKYVFTQHIATFVEPEYQHNIEASGQILS